MFELRSHIILVCVILTYRNLYSEARVIHTNESHMPERHGYSWHAIGNVETW
jgi:hypothetical protein